ncbi:phosphate ABC transporter substrate-binding protein [Pseudomonas sp. S25]|uniref:Phosphate ABC transporter substrate-binding protein n=1 Tax=Pseudomonas maioricensis TaxID=1766623 RepID=A0ABS9ZIQ8_9PSED|nr:PhnD/SsuA/transferrin family substrate-binding protein [Pseudomonas sp. S25]MCI8209447.1 phosphate ABC transporter substrate-binding protein [Pseudomonas sp. S25]
MIQGIAELPMYNAPARVAEASEAWLARIFEVLGAQRLQSAGLDLPQLWLSDQLLFAQTCGYPLMTLLSGKVRLLGRPVYELPHSADGMHCSLLVVRADDPRRALTAFCGSHALVNSEDSNSGMNLFRHAVAPLQREGRFFSRVSLTGGHRHSLRELKEGRGDLAAIDSVTYDYLARDASEEVSGLRILGRTASSPCLPFITALSIDAVQADAIRLAMNQALLDLPDVAQALAIKRVMPAQTDEYQVLLDYERQASEQGLPLLFF